MSRDMHLDPHLRARGLLETVQFPPERGIGKRRIIGRPWHLSKTKLGVRGPAPTLGQHNREVLQGILGYAMHATRRSSRPASSAPAPPSHGRQ